MNIIKFKDQIRPNDKLFNQHLKGRYAYWLHMRYIVPFNFINSSEYVKFENDITALTDQKRNKCKQPEIPYWDLLGKDAELEAWVDIDGTEDSNSIRPFERHNKYTTDEDITLEEVKKFRTWLAKTLLEFDAHESGRQKNLLFTEDFTSVLQYYAGGMYDQCIKTLSKVEFEHNVASIDISDCGCAGRGNASTLYGDSITGCDPVKVYRRYMYNEMIKEFSQIEFWDQFPTSFIIEFKQYVDNVIQLNLPLKNSDNTNVFKDCPCLNNSGQTVNLDILNRLSRSLMFFIENEIQGNKNYITSALRDWASELYESMEWA